MLCNHHLSPDAFLFFKTGTLSPLNNNPHGPQALGKHPPCYFLCDFSVYFLCNVQAQWLVLAGCPESYLAAFLLLSPYCASCLSVYFFSFSASLPPPPLCSLPLPFVAVFWSLTGTTCHPASGHFFSLFGLFNYFSGSRLASFPTSIF